MITDSNGMPVIQPLVDDASTATFNTAFGLIGTSLATRGFFRGTQAARETFRTSGQAQKGDHWQDTNGDEREWKYSGTAWIVEPIVRSGAFGGVTDSSGIVTITHNLGIAGGHVVAQLLSTSSDPVTRLSRLVEWGAATPTQASFRLIRSDTNTYYQDSISFDWIAVRN